MVGKDQKISILTCQIQTIWQKTEPLSTLCENKICSLMYSFQVVQTDRSDYNALALPILFGIKRPDSWLKHKFLPVGLRVSNLIIFNGP